MDMLNSLDWKCSDDGAIFKTYMEEMRIFKFLIGLSDSLDEVRGRILSVKPLSSIQEVVSEVRREESRKKVMLIFDSVLTSGEVLALAARGNPNNPPDGDDCDELSRLKEYLATEFEIKNLGPLKYFLGMEVAKSGKCGIFVTQRKYTHDLLFETDIAFAVSAVSQFMYDHLQKNI
ncbi:hypothetical protein EZV62_007333 [Acer yangbiense]|uniref:Reverse transcriptase Ty1/copia-type domain-containing protein n=1 Tax=Acer yangbiense TaxID=1000413 RepID=A0A5C7IAA0_9ROSI|nr:hypothetical protein EZV62_007333 [Acer yangbiense]